MRWPIAPTAAALSLLLLLTAILSLTLGALSLPVWDSILTVFNQSAEQLAPYQKVIVLELRLPRLLLAMLVGAILAQCGAVSQGLFRNPLADPGIIGVSAGAAVGAILAIVLCPPEMAVWAVPTAAFAGGLVSTLLVYSLAQTRDGTSVLILLLAGVAIAAFAGAAIGILSYFADDADLRQLSLWQMGSLAGANDNYIWLCLITLILLLIIFQRRADALNAILLGEAEARHLGIEVESLKRLLILLIAAGVGITVAAAGIIGFIGLVVPHLVRMTTGPNHHTLLPLSALCGAVLLTLADLIARLIVAPAELPVGLVTALLGAPVLMALILKQGRPGA